MQASARGIGSAPSPAWPNEQGVADRALGQCRATAVDDRAALGRFARGSAGHLSAMAESTTLVLFGATGDLARSKLWPALHDLAASGRPPGRTSGLGTSRSADP